MSRKAWGSASVHGAGNSRRGCFPSAPSRRPKCGCVCGRLHLVLLQACQVVRRPVAYPCWPPARSRPGRRLVLADLLAWSALPAAGGPAWLITDTLPELLHLVLLQACQVVCWPVACCCYPPARSRRCRRLVAADLLRLACVLPVAGLSPTDALPELPRLVLLQACQAVRRPVACLCWPPARSRPGRRLVLADLLRLASVLPAAGLVNPPARCPACCTWCCCRPGRWCAGRWPAAGGHQLEAGVADARCCRSASLVSALPAAGLVNHQRAARAAAPGAAAGLPGGALAGGLPVLATGSKPARPAPDGDRSAAPGQRAAICRPGRSPTRCPSCCNRCCAGLPGGALARALQQVATSSNPARPTPGAGRSADLVSMLPVAGLVDHQHAARAAAPGAAAGLPVGAHAAGPCQVATRSKPARPTPAGG